MQEGGGRRGTLPELYRMDFLVLQATWESGPISCPPFCSHYPNVFKGSERVSDSA
jgi:hypothetical protein